MPLSRRKLRDFFGMRASLSASGRHWRPASAARRAASGRLRPPLRAYPCGGRSCCGLAPAGARRGAPVARAPRRPPLAGSSLRLRARGVPACGGAVGALALRSASRVARGAPRAPFPPRSSPRGALAPSGSALASLGRSRPAPPSGFCAPAGALGWALRACGRAAIATRQLRRQRRRVALAALSIAFRRCPPSRVATAG